MSETKPVRLGAIGTGGIAATHFRNLRTIPGVDLVAFCDVSRDRAQSAAERFSPHARISTDVHDLLAAGDLDGVYVTVPPFAHGEIELAVLEAGVPMYVEKPVALSLDLARRIGQQIAERQALVCVGYHWRYTPAGARVQEALAGSTIGLVYGYYKTRPPQGKGWLTVKEQSGGQMVEQTTHIIDMARLLAGDVKSVYARFANRVTGPAPGFTAADIGTATIEFASGALGTISNCWLVPLNHASGLEVWTDKALVEFDQRSLRLRHDNEVTDVPLPPAPEGVSNHYYADKAFVDAIRTGDRSLIRAPYDEAVKSLAVSLAAAESAATGQAVQLR
jgi:predicted dehydrogenase